MIYGSNIRGPGLADNSTIIKYLPAADAKIHPYPECKNFTYLATELTFENTFLGLITGKTSLILNFKLKGIAGGAVFSHNKK